MPAAATITPAEIRAFANFPSEVPEALLSKHIQISLRDLIRATGKAAAPEALTEEWNEALTVRALASVFPWLNTFSLSGAAKVGRLEGSVEYRFLDPDETDARVTELNQRFDALVAQITPAEAEGAPDDQVDTGCFTMIAI